MRVTISLILCLILCLLIGYCQSQAKVVTPDRIKPSSSNIDESKELYSSMLQNKKIAPAHSTAQLADEIEILSLEETKTGNNVIPADELKYVGSWKLVGQSKMNWFKSEEGYSQFFIRQDVNAIFTWLYDGKYNDKNAIKLEIPFLDQDLHLEDGTISSEKAPLTITFINEYEVITKNDACTASYLVKFSFRNESDKNNSHSDQRANASLVLKSDDCHLTIHGLYSDRDQKGTSNALLYTVFVTALCCMHICACLQFMKDLANNPSEASKYSLATIAFFLGWDILLGFYHFYNAVLNPQYLEFFLMPAFWFMTLSTIFEARVLLCIWAIRHHQNSQNVGRRTSFFRFFLGLILPLFMSVSHFEKLRDSVLLVLMMLVHFFLYKNWCLLLSGLFFIPQIIHNAVEDHNFPRDYNYMLGLGLSRMLIPLYARGYSNNVFLLTPDLSFCFWYVVISLTQICVLLLQARLGSRFFIPKIFMPKMFDYYMDGEIDLKTLDTVEDSCSICIQKFSETPEGDASKGERLMRTPCKHIFHERCLKKWMHIKFECPFCKSSIPPYF